MTAFNIKTDVTLECPHCRQYKWALREAKELLPKIYAQRVTWRAESKLALALAALDAKEKP